MKRDGEVSAAVAAAVHDPFSEAWQRHEEDVWQPVREALEGAAAAHAEVLDELVAASSGSGADEGARARYRERVAAEVLGAVRAALSVGGVAVRLKTSLDDAAERARETADGLPALVSTPISATALGGSTRSGPVAAAKRLLARGLRPIMWRRQVHDIAVAEVARRHLARVVVPAQRRAFRASQRRRAEWLGGVERAWAGWVVWVFAPPPDEDGDDGGAGSAPVAKQHVKAGEALQIAIEALAGQVDRASGHEANGDLDGAESILRATVAVAGTFVADGPASAEEGLTATSGKRRGADDGELADRWDEWAGEAAARLGLYAAFLDLRAAMDSVCRKLAEAWRSSVGGVDAGLQRIQDELAAGRRRVERLRAEAAGQEARAALEDALAREKLDTADALKRVAGGIASPAELLRTLTAEAEGAVLALAALTDGAAETVTLHGLPREDAAIRRPGRDSITVRVREAALQAFDTLRMERIRTTPALVEEALGRIRTEITDLRAVASYGYETAIAETVADGDPGPGRSIGVVTEALSLASAKAAGARQVLMDALVRSQLGMTGEVAEGIRHLVQRVLADRLAGRYLDARSYLLKELARHWEQWRGRMAQGGRRAAATLRGVRAQLQPVTGALGIGPDASEDARRNPLAAVDQVVAGLPVVYRRLFALEPVTDPRLLAGRDDPLDGISSAWTRWGSGDRRALVVIAPPGSGMTSLLNVAANQCFGADTLRVRETLRERIRDETHLAAQLADWLGVESAPDLDGLADFVTGAPSESIPPVAVLEGLELLHLRVPGGSRLFEALLNFMSRTESRIFWVVGLPSPAWQLIEKRSPSFVGDIERMELGELGPLDLRDAVLARHRLSGLPLSYAEPKQGQDALRYRARRISRNARQQRLIETDYFQRLHRASLGSVRLALFQWLRSADFDTIEGSVLVKPIERLAPFMHVLDLPQCFALKALLDHGTLSVAEYCEVARAREPEGLHRLRSLTDLHIAELARPDIAGDASHGRPDDPAKRYRIRSIMTGPVAAHLKSLNILH